MKSKTQPPELIFVVLNFVALDDCTHHAPFAIERKSSSEHHQSDRNSEISSLILRLIAKDTVNRTVMPDIEPCIRSRSCAHSRWLLPDDLYRTLPTGTNFCGVQNFVTATSVTKIMKISAPQKLPATRYLGKGKVM